VQETPTTIIFVALSILAGCQQDQRHGEDERAWARLQGIEYRDRANTIPGPILKTSPDGLAYLGIPGIGAPNVGRTDPPASQRSWIVLNEHSPTGRVRQINTYAKYDLDCKYVTEVETRVPDMDHHVRQLLRNICGQQRP
jgi:hypothetical protein